MITRRSVLGGSAALALGAVTGCSGSDGPAGSSPSASAAAPTSPTPSAAPASSASPSPSADPSSSPTGKPDPKVAGTVAEDLEVPWGMAFLASGDAIVGERNAGRLLRISPKGKVTLLGEVSGVVAPSGQGEGGLLGLALLPGDEDTLFAYFTTGSDNRVARIDIRGGKLRKPDPVLTGIPTSVHHNGGRLLFEEKTGLLYVSTGDAEQSQLAQDKSSLAGKILRIRPDGRIAPGNPFGTRTYSYGHRNIEGLAFDASGRLWATEFGDKQADELNLIRAGRNYGWPQVEGASSDDRYESPKATWSPTSGCSPAGLAITRSTAFVGALQGKCLFSIALDGTGAGKPVKHFGGDYGRIRNVAAAPDGSLWMTTSNTDGRVDPGPDDDRILRVSL